MKREAKPRTHSGILSMKNHKAENYTSTLFLKHFFLSGNHNRRKRWWLPLSNFSEKNRETNAAFAY